MTLSGLDVILAMDEERVERGCVRSRGCVAPREVTRALLRGETVVMMGLNPDNFAYWITRYAVRYNELETIERNQDIPACPTADDPPMMRIGSSAYLPGPSSFQGAVSPAPARGALGESVPLALYSPMTAVATATGSEDASSKETCDGICEHI